MTGRLPALLPAGLPRIWRVWLGPDRQSERLTWDEVIAAAAPRGSS